MRKQLLFITDGIFPHAVGGMQRHSALLLEKLAKTNTLEIIVVHPHQQQVFPSELGIKEISLPFTFDGFYIKKCWEYSKLVYDIIKQYPKAIIYAQGISVLKGMPAIGNRVIVNPHGLEPFQSLTLSDKIKTLPLRLLEKYQFKHAAKIVSLGGKLTKILQNEIANGRNKVVILPNAVNPGPAQTRQFNDEKISLLFVGRFAFNKGINILMEAVRQLNNEGYLNRLQFNIVGKGPLYEQYVNLYNFPNVNFVGFADDDQLVSLYKENDLFVFPTLFEGMPTVVLEAMSASMPVIVTDTGATAELVDSDNGFLIETANVRALKWAIQRYYQLKPEEKKALSDKSYQKVIEKFTWEKVARQHLDLFDNFMA